MAVKKVTITDGCTACGICAQVCPDVFDVGETATVKEGADLNGHEAQIREAAEGCPVSAINVE